MNNYSEETKKSLADLKDTLGKIPNIKKEIARLYDLLKNEENLKISLVQYGWFYLNSSHQQYLDEVADLFPEYNLEEKINEFKSTPKIIKCSEKKNKYYLLDSIEGTFNMVGRKEIPSIPYFIGLFKKFGDVKLSSNRERMTIGNRVFGVNLEKHYYDYKYWELVTFWEIK